MPKGFQKGNPGKPKGAIHLKTKQWDALGLMHEESGAETAKKIMDKYAELSFDMDGSINDKYAEKFMEHYKAILEYFKPKQSRIEQTTKIESEPITFILPNGNKSSS